MSTLFSNLSERLNKITKNLRGQGRLTEKNIEDTLRDIRIALLEADVALPVAKSFIENIKPKAIGTEVIGSLNPGQVLINLVHDELISLMGEKNESLNLNTQPPAVILMAGLQGSGKTTTTAKLANWIKNTLNKSVMVTSSDVYRPAAIEQLQTLAKQLDVHFYPSKANDNPVDIAKSAIQEAKNKVLDVLIIDTAGRLHIDEEMMSEIKRIHSASNPIETLFVVDSMTGQDAANTAKAFHEALPLTGVVLTKADGDARGGAALSIREITGKPIKFLGMGEKIDALEPFDPERIVKRILDMGDVVDLVKQAHEKIDKEKAEKLVKKVKAGKTLTFLDLKDQFEQIKKMGGLSSIMSKLPGMAQIPQKLKNQFDDSKITRMVAMIDSMTKDERRFPNKINPSRKRRICSGSGTTVQELNQLLKQFESMKKMMKKAKKGGMMNMMRGMGGKMPFGGSGFPPLG